MSDRFDAIIVGTGQAGPPLAGRLTKAGWKVAVIERRHFGGTCVNDGCTPTKTMVASARAAHMARRAADYGVVLKGDVRVDLGAVQDRKDKLVMRSRNGIDKWLRGMDGCEVIDGHARLTGPESVAVGDRVLHASKIFLNVGTRPRVDGVDGVDDVPYLTNTDMLALRELPEHLIVVGGSYIGLEFGQMFRRFGSEVTIVEHGPRIVGREDELASATLHEILTGEGVSIHTDATCLALERDGDGVAVRLECDGLDAVRGSHVLLATGRTPNTDDLGLQAAGVETDERGYIGVDEQLRSNVPSVYALGDCNGEGAFTHTSYNDFEIVAGHVLDDDERALGDRITCYALYTDPPLARAGMNDGAVRKTGRPALVGHLPMQQVGRAREMGETAGFLRILVDAESNAILGATLLGVGADEVIHQIIDVMYARAPYTTISRAVHIHPTVSELIPTTLQGLEPLT